MYKIGPLKPTGRWSELLLLFWPAAIATVGLAGLAHARGDGISPGTLYPAAVLAAGFLVWHLALCLFGSRADQAVLPIAGGLAAMGLITVARLDPDSLSRQTVWVLLGVLVGLAAIVPLRDLTWLKRYKYTWATAGIAILLATFVLGQDPHGGGARLWISFGPVQFQPSELLKVLLAVFLAAYLDDKRELLSAGALRLGAFSLPPLPHLGPLLTMWGLSMLLLVVLKDLGLSLLLFGLFLAMLYVATSRQLYVWGGLALFAVAVFGAYQLFYHVRTRVTVWLDPWVDPLGSSFQIVQSLLALASGGVLGTGLGRGQPDLIPAAATDFPFAAIGEEWGLAGALAVLALYLILVYRGYAIALRAFDPFQQLLATGLTTVLALQVFVIVGGNIKLIPLTGITLPFVSYGGSSLLTNFAAVAMLLAISHRGAKVPS